MTHKQLELRVRWLTRYAFAATLVLALLILSGAADSVQRHVPWFSAGVFKADTVQTEVLIARQVRVIEPDGSLALLASANLSEDQRAAARAQLRERQRRGDFGGRRAALESTERVAALRLNDYRGRERFRIVVDSLSAARLEFLDENGEVVRSISGE